MKRKYRVEIVDAMGNVVVTFTGTVVDKKQFSGRYGLGNVDETLIVDPGYKIKVKKGKNVTLT